MEEEVYRNAAVDRRRLKALAQRSDAKGLVQLGGHLGLLAAGGTAVLLVENSLVYVVALAGYGMVLIFLFAALHESIHRTAFASRWLNDAAAQAIGFILVLPANYFRAFHFQHHRFTQQSKRDPELAAPPINSLAAYLWQVSGLPYWRERVSAIAKHSLGRVDEDFVPRRQKPTIIREAQVHAAAYLVLLAGNLGLGSTLLLELWVLPAVLAQPILRLFLLAEHFGCPQTENMLMNSRTTQTSKLLQWLCWNMNRHSAHHAYPALPFHALPAADRLLADQPVTRAGGYLAVHKTILAALRRHPADVSPLA